MTNINMNMNMNIGTPNILRPNVGPYDWGGLQRQPIVNSIQTSNIGNAFKANEAGVSGSHVVLVVDELGSMGHLKASTISAVNEYIQGQRKDSIENKTKTVVSVFTFDGYNVKRIIAAADVLSSPSINEDNYNPIGMTNLNDAFGGVIATINDEIGKVSLNERPSVVITVMTDGLENASKSFTLSDVNSMVGKCQNAKWAFLFLGANIDAFSVGSNYGMSAQSTMNYSASTGGVTETLSAATRMTNSVKSMRSANPDISVYDTYNSVGFSDQERTSAMGGLNESI